MHDEYILNCLNKAYAMELGITQMLKVMIREEKNFSTFREPLENHLEETKSHAQMVKNRMKELGGKISKTRTLSSQFMKSVKAMATQVMPHKDIRNLELAYTTEHLEMALYRQLQIIAEQAGDTETASVCRDILEDEMSAARILEDLMPVVFEKDMVEDLKHSMKL